MSALEPNPELVPSVLCWYLVLQMCHKAYLWCPVPKLVQSQLVAWQSPGPPGSGEVCGGIEGGGEEHSGAGLGQGGVMPGGYAGGGWLSSTGSTASLLDLAT